MAMTGRGIRRSVARVTGRDPERTPDSVMLARIRAGDDDAIAIVYDQHAALVYGLACRVTRDPQLARDIAQDVFTYLWEYPDRVDLARGSVRTYLAVVTHRRAVDEVRRNERRVRIEAGAEVVPHTNPEVEVVDEVMHVWRSQRLATGLAMLPAEQRLAIQLAYYDGLTYKQVAQTLGIPEGTAKSRLRLAMARLRVLLGDDVRTALT
jgi:RNA polymerase sigma-70 factor (ECF subfamily)